MSPDSLVIEQILSRMLPSPCLTVGRVFLGFKTLPAMSKTQGGPKHRNEAGTIMVKRSSENKKCKPYKVAATGAKHQS